MPKFIIKYDAGFGDSFEVIEADSLDKAKECAYEAAVEESEKYLKWFAEPWTAELAEELGLAEGSDDDDCEVESENEPKTKGEG